MDGRGRLAQSLTWIARRRARAPNHAARRLSVQHDTFTARSLTARYARRVFMPILRIRVPRGIGLAATLLIIVGGLVYGVIRGDHVPTILAALGIRPPADMDGRARLPLEQTSEARV